MNTLTKGTAPRIDGIGTQIPQIPFIEIKVTDTAAAAAAEAAAFKGQKATAPEGSAFGSKGNKERPKNDKKHRRSKSGGFLATNARDGGGVHWDNLPSQFLRTGPLAKEFAEEKRCKKSHNVVRPIIASADVVALKRRDKNGGTAVALTDSRPWPPQMWPTGEGDAVNRNDAIQPSPPAKSQKNLTKVKRSYSVHRHDSLMTEEMPVFTESDRRLRKSVPSSPQTILALAGLFVCGLILMISGLIVLCTTWKSARTLKNGWHYQVAGFLMLFLGFTGVGICAILQRKNIAKLAEDTSKDLFNVAANAAASEAKRASEERALAGGSRKLNRMLSQVPSTMI
uniref:Transmembrane protein n=1 Tax=Globodera rostochiensis TaxID=31243 RepID=A0A914I9Y1_GLORO